MSNIYSIYKITNQINQKVYIGFTSEQNPYDRFKGHQYDAHKGSKCYIHNTLRKHGSENFLFEVIYQSEDGDYCLNTMEPFFIKQYDSYENGYNLTIGGEGVVGYKHSREARRKMSEAHKGKVLTEETRKKISKANTGNSHTEEAKRRITEASIGKVLSEETKRKLSEAHKGRVFSDNHKLKISKGNKGKIRSKELRRKLSRERRGNRWINNGIINKRVKLEDFDDYLVKGFTSGRMSNVNARKTSSSNPL